MQDSYLIIVGLLFILAITDLVVGVSNDAVNFLNSAIGSKVARRWVIMVIASLGIIAGAVFSSGMMEVARKGIFVPSEFAFSDIMAVFAAVMLTDIILLDLFNTFGMPTSTTVSIVFELLGASVFVAILKMSRDDIGIGHLGEYINTETALVIILGIFLSIAIAFTIGALVQYFSRLLFTYNYSKRLKFVGGLWGGLALTALSYFLVFKGMKHVDAINGIQIAVDAAQCGIIDKCDCVVEAGQNLMTLGCWLKMHTWTFLGISFLFWTAVMQLLVSVFKVNIFRIVVLFGTFSLAMAFAGNDLVNFIGVPMAGFESYNQFIAQADGGLGPDAFMMDGLAKKVPTNPLFLLAAGAIMVVTLWVSKKARSVTETEINLGRQDEGSERFSSNPFARGIVRMSYTIANGLGNLLPQGAKNGIERAFQPFEKPLAPGEDPAAFDMVRASVNLAVASVLIAIATSKKLPLSTTYVSFMVAMGTSLADRAWGRDSAVYRISGVLNVIGGWFLTALIAFSVAGIFALAIHTFGMWAIGVLLGLAIFSMIRSTLHHKKKEKAKEEEKKELAQAETLNEDNILPATRTKVAETLKVVSKTYKDAMQSLLTEDHRVLGQLTSDVGQVMEANERFRSNLYRHIKAIKEEGTEGSRVYLKVYDLEEDMVQSIRTVVEEVKVHVQNLHSPLEKDQAELLDQVRVKTLTYLGNVEKSLGAGQFGDMDDLLSERKALYDQIEDCLRTRVEGIRSDDFSARNSLLYFRLLMETQDIVAVVTRFYKLFARNLEDGTQEVKQETSPANASQEEE